MRKIFTSFIIFNTFILSSLFVIGAVIFWLYLNGTPTIVDHNYLITLRSVMILWGISILCVFSDYFF